MNMEQIGSKSPSHYSFKTKVKETFRKAEILGWYLCYKIVAGPQKEHPAKSLNN